MNHSVARFGVVLLTLLVFASCQVGKKPVRKNVTIDKYAIKERYGMNSVDTIPVTKELPGSGGVGSEQKKTLTAMLLNLADRQVPFVSFSGKAKMHHIAGNDKQEFVAHIRIKKDSIIWINVTALGGTIPVARVLITPDSISLINNLQKEVRQLQIGDVNKLLPVSVDFATMQNLIMGNVLKQSGNPVDVGDFGGTWTMQVKDSQMVQQLSFNKADSSIRTLQMRTADDSTQGLVQYGGYEIIDNKLFSMQRVITINNAGDEHYIDMNFNKVDFDEPLDFPFNIPKSYDKK
ncbi:MAG: hypothetical protein BGO70_05295 [Bacteroidetes bacterium 43-93]|nr:DUF4292 domain-containing protein [Bacteroidota bacterium]OJW96816.1 MAG: hypothetical protein BGO70_05295 [Bacteroidetes bacterium 43-93]